MSGIMLKKSIVSLLGYYTIVITLSVHVVYINRA